ncbi:MAG: hypothetical protein IKR25_10150 [Muribaculaceae bacterium]|nr:hypothetical protein [Muribaculaceae bacterium]
MIIIKNRRTKMESILKEYPDAQVFDVTSKGDYKLFSPFYPHGGIPIPFSGTVTSQSVEGIWQGLKVFEHEGIDFDCFNNKTMKNLKRTVRTHGRCLGHQKGLGSKELLGYIEARRLIYVPSYMWMLEHKCHAELEQFRRVLAQGKTLVLLDYETNENVEDPSKPLSHASLIKKYLQEEAKD